MKVKFEYECSEKEYVAGLEYAKEIMSNVLALLDKGQVSEIKIPLYEDVKDSGIQRVPTTRETYKDAVSRQTIPVAKQQPSIFGVETIEDPPDVLKGYGDFMGEFELPSEIDSRQILSAASHMKNPKRLEQGMNEFHSMLQTLMAGYRGDTNASDSTVIAGIFREHMSGKNAFNTLAFICNQGGIASAIDYVLLRYKDLYPVETSGTALERQAHAWKASGYINQLASVYYPDWTQLFEIKCPFEGISHRGDILA